MYLLIIFTALALVLRAENCLCFHIDSSPEHARKTYLSREQNPNQIRHDQLPPKAYTDDDRSWRFPQRNYVRAVGDTKLSSLASQERLRQPAPKLIRTAPSMGTYLDEDRMWRKPGQTLTRKKDCLPPETLKDEERFWWKGENFEQLLLEDNEEFTMHDSASQHAGGGNLFRRPTAKFSRHPHSKGEFDDNAASTMVEDDSLGWLTESTHKLLMDDEDVAGDSLVGSC